MKTVDKNMFQVKAAWETAYMQTFPAVLAAIISRPDVHLQMNMMKNNVSLASQYAEMAADHYIARKFPVADPEEIQGNTDMPQEAVDDPGPQSPPVSANEDDPRLQER